MSRTPAGTATKSAPGRDVRAGGPAGPPVAGTLGADAQVLPVVQRLRRTLVSDVSTMRHFQAKRAATQGASGSLLASASMLSATHAPRFRGETSRDDALPASESLEALAWSTDPRRRPCVDVLVTASAPIDAQASHVVVYGWIEAPLALLPSSLPPSACAVDGDHGRAPVRALFAANDSVGMAVRAAAQRRVSPRADDARSGDGESIPWMRIRVFQPLSMLMADGVLTLMCTQLSEVIASS